VLPGIEARRIGQGLVVGRALPVRLQPKSNDPSAYRFGGGVGKPLEQVLQTMRDGDVVVMDLGGSNRAAAWGGLASRIAQRRGVRGTIMWGACRDVEEIRATGYPVWSVATCPRRSRNEFTFGGQPDSWGAGMAVVLDAILAQGYGPDGFEQRDGYRVYRYKPLSQIIGR